MKKTELLSPAGSLEKLKYAIEYGADAVYLGLPDFSLRARINQFSESDIKKAVEYAHKRKKKMYITLNIYAHNQHLPKIEKHLKFLKSINPDGAIVSDPGIINLVKKYLPGVDIHLSTQANATNWQAVKFWAEQGVKRIILAREATLAEIKEIKKKVKNIELEYFVHGAMCMSYSGRCILSAWMTGRSANLGDCAQPCRWLYKVKKKKEKGKNGTKCHPELVSGSISVEEDLKKYKIDLEEDQHGTYFFNSCDLNLIEYIDKLIDAGIDSLKIEGRAKSAYYLAVATRAYRKVIDATVGAIHELPKRRSVVKEQKKELENLTHRGYTTGFLLGKHPEHNFSGENFGNKFQFVGEVMGAKNNLNIVKVHNELFLKDKIEAVAPERNIPVKIKKMYDHNMKEIREAHGGHKRMYYFELDCVLDKMTIVRKVL